MPFEIQDDNAECDAGQYAVVKVGESDSLGCHDTVEEAQEQVDALYANESQINAEQPALERRVAPITEWGDGMSFSGYASVFDSPSQWMGFSETVTRGAFEKTLKARNNIMLLHSHNPDLILASTRAKTLTLEEDDHGLRVTADLADTTWGRDVAELVRRGDLGHMSFGFSVPPGGDEWTEDMSERAINEVRLHEVSTVGAPAYLSTSTDVRALPMPSCVGDGCHYVSALERFTFGEPLGADDADLLVRAVGELRIAETPRIPARLAALQLEHQQRREP